MGLSNGCACIQKLMADETGANYAFVTASMFLKKRAIPHEIDTCVIVRARVGHDSCWIAFATELVIAFVMPHVAQNNFTMISTT